MTANLTNFVRKSYKLIAIAVSGAISLALANETRAIPLKTTATTLYTFNYAPTSLNDAWAANPALLQASDGNFYGTSQFGGTADNGIIFEYNPTTKVESVLHSFGDGSVSSDGSQPLGNLIQATDGNLYGTTELGGSAGIGTIFEYNLTTKLTTILHSFGDGSVSNDGSAPLAGLLQASDGNFYGTTSRAGTGGALFKYSPTTKQLTILHFFGDGTVPGDGFVPAAAVIQASDGNLYGTTVGGGNTGTKTNQFIEGTIFKYNLTSNVASVVYAFGQNGANNDASGPMSPLVQGSDGNFYGTTQTGGATSTELFTEGSGAIFEYNPTTKVETILHSFEDGSVVPDGSYPDVGLTIGKDGNFYGTTRDTIFEYNPTTKLTSTLVDSSSPNSPLIIGADGNYYGTALAGGYGEGAIIEVQLGKDTQGMSFPAGVQMLSIPYSYSASSLDSVFGYTGVKLAVWLPLDLDYIYTPTAPANTLNAGQAYWANFPQQTTITAPGTPADPTKSVDIHLSTGWNMIGDPFLVAVPILDFAFNKGTETLTQAINYNNPLIGDTVYEYNPTLHKYLSTLTIGPLQGYWIYAYANTDLTIPAPGPVATPAIYHKRKSWLLSVLRQAE